MWGQNLISDTCSLTMASKTAIRLFYATDILTNIIISTSLYTYVFFKYRKCPEKSTFLLKLVRIVSQPELALSNLKQNTHKSEGAGFNLLEYSIHRSQWCLSLINILYYLSRPRYDENNLHRKYSSDDSDVLNANEDMIRLEKEADILFKR